MHPGLRVVLSRIGTGLRTPSKCPWRIRQERRLRAVFAPNEVAAGGSTRRITDVVTELGLRSSKPPEPLDAIEADEANLVVWNGRHGVGDLMRDGVSARLASMA